MKLNSLFNIPGSRKARKRICRGNGSGTGRTGGRGEKGQKSRSGVAIKTEGGQMPIIKRLPKRGFNSDKSVNYTTINMIDIDVLVSENRINLGSVFSKETLVEMGYIKNANIPVKLLGGVDKIQFKITIDLDAYSKSARSVVEKAGGKLI